MLRRTLAALGGAVLLAGLAGFGAAAPARAMADDTCPNQHVLDTYDSKNMWRAAGNRGAGQTIGVVGSQDKVAEAVCAAKALAPDATVVPDSASGPIVVLADGSATPPANDPRRLLIAGAGDTGGPMPQRPGGIVYVAAAASSTGTAQPTSSYGPAVMVAAYGDDTSTAAGYVGALAAILHAQHPDWMARQVAAQIAYSIGWSSGNANEDRLGFGIIVPDQAVSVPPTNPDSLPSRFAVAYPAVLPPGDTVPSSPSASSSTPPSSPPSSPASASASASATEVPTDLGSANLFPTNQAFATSPSNGSHAAAGGSGGSGGFNPILLIGFVVLLAGGGYVLWRRRQTRPADVRPEEEWEAPSGPRHSGYSPPEE